MSQHKDYDKVIGVLVKMLGGHVILTREDIEDAPDIEVRQLFETDQVEMRTTTKSENALTEWLKTNESWN